MYGIHIIETSVDVIRNILNSAPTYYLLMWIIYRVLYFLFLTVLNEQQSYSMINPA